MEDKLKLTTKEQKDLFSELLIGTKKETITNPYSQRSVELCPEAVAVYDFIIGAERILNKIADKIHMYAENKEVMKIADKTTQEFYTARDIFIENWPKEYTILLD